MAENPNPNFRHIVRVVNSDLDGNKQVYIALRKIKGVNFMFANMVLQMSGVAHNKKAGDLTDAEIQHLDEIIRNPLKYGAPTWMINRRRDYETDEDMHLLTSDLTYQKENDIKRLKKMKSYRGTRHQARLPARGQRTRSNFRRAKGKSSIGVKGKGKGKK